MHESDPTPAARPPQHIEHDYSDDLSPSREQGARVNPALQPTRVMAPSSAARRDQPSTRPNSLADLARNLDMSISLDDSEGGDGFRMPAIGDRLFRFQLRRELGRGAFARVFLATQADLAGRPVVLKVSRSVGTEPQTLAQLQHTNIVPVYSVHEYPQAGLRALCMPYFGGASLSQVLDKVWRGSAGPRAGAELIRGVDEAAGAPPPAGTETSGQTPRTRLEQLPYPRAAAWVVAALADGLAHAHQRRVLHRDIKPSNVLIAADGQPMLLDFNLADDAAQDQTHALLGGTIAYMSPEHLRALSAASRKEGRREVDHRADIYSMGMVLYEMLTGRSPFHESASHTPLPLLVEAMAVERGQAPPSVRKVRPDTPWNLESIVRHCMAPDPAHRYQRAEHLAEDLRCFLEDRPLRYAPELSLGERAEKWVRRHPRLTWAGAVAAVAACVLTLGALAFVEVNERLHDTSDQLAVAQAEERKRQFEEGTVRALFYANTRNELGDHLTLGEAAARETLELYDILNRPDWQDNPDWKRLAPQDRTRLAEDARDLLLLLAGARVRLANWDRESLVAALALLDKAAGISGVAPCRALETDRAAYRDRLGDAAGAAAGREKLRSIPATSAHDHYLLAMAHAREQKYAQAVAHLNDAVRLNPRDYWAWMQRGLCHQEMGQTVLAVGDFGTCVGLRPDFAWGYYNRAVALTAAGRRSEAVLDYRKALELDPDLLAARLNCGILHLELKQYPEALAALTAVRRAGRDDAALHCGLGMALEALGRHEDADEAFALALRRAAAEPKEVRLRVRRAIGFAVAERSPSRARAAFNDVLGENHDDPEALYGLGMLHDRKGQQEEALRYFSRALEAAPAFEEARRFRAVVLARRGDFAAARIDINACLSKENASGGTYYAAACIAALETEKANPGRAEECAAEALAMLREAFVKGHGLSAAKDDDDLRGIQNRPEFARLLAEAPKLAADR
jgi:serine/threonine protein kinase/Flp pilus assembly protein TadD